MSHPAGDDMGMAYQGPENGNRTKRYISKHAMDRLRQRSKSIVHLREFDLMYMIDDVVERAIKEKAQESIVDGEGEDATLVDLTNTLDQSLVMGSVFALLKQDLKEGRREAVVTILDEKAAQRLRKREVTYKQVVEEPFNPAFQALADMKIPPKEIKSDVGNDPPPAEEPTYLVLSGSGEESVILLIDDKEHVIRLLESRGREGIRLFKECKLKIKVEVEE